MHERLTPNQAVQFCKEAEKFRMFFLEDPLSPEDNDYFHQIRAQCATPIAMGELFNSPHEWQPLIEQRLIDYIRVHVSQAGGFSPSAKDRDPGRAVWRENGMAWTREMFHR
jgi:mannonate dehydratase